MSTLLVFEDPVQLLNYVNTKIDEIGKQLENLQREYLEIRTKAEKFIKLEELFNEILGIRVSEIREIDLRGIKIIMDARPIDELKVYEEIISSLQDKVEALQRVKKEVIIPLVNKLKELKGITLIVQVVNDIPTKILIKFR